MNTESLIFAIKELKKRGRPVDYLEELLAQRMHQRDDSDNGVDIFALGREINQPYVSEQELLQLQTFGFVVYGNKDVEKAALRASRRYEFVRSRGEDIGF